MPTVEHNALELEKHQCFMSPFSSFTKDRCAAKRRGIIGSSDQFCQTGRSRASRKPDFIFTLDHYHL